MQVKTVLSVLLSGIWVSLSEFFRNEYLLKSKWTEHYESLGLTFPSDPVNGMVWGIWSLCFAAFIYLLYTRFSFYKTIGIAWFAGFVLMWLVTANMAVLPLGILPFAVPLSLIETYIAALIIARLNPNFRTNQG